MRTILLKHKMVLTFLIFTTIALVAFSPFYTYAEQPSRVIYLCVSNKDDCLGLSKVDCLKKPLFCKYKSVSKTEKGSTFTAEACFSLKEDSFCAKFKETCSNQALCKLFSLTVYSPPQLPTSSVVTTLNSNSLGQGATNEKSETENNISSTPFPTLENPLSSSATPQKMIGKIINIIMGLVGSLALIMFIFGGVSWMTAGGNEEKVKKSIGIIVWSVIGLAAIFLSYALVRLLITNVI